MHVSVKFQSCSYQNKAISAVGQVMLWGTGSLELIIK